MGAAVEPDNLKAELSEVRSDLHSLVKNYDAGRIIREGIPTAIVGRPNVGKSTLFNLLSGYQRSIVTDIAGTTRDVIEESFWDIRECLRYSYTLLRLSDTAGIRDTDDMIEGIGVEIAEKMIDSAELVLAVFDGGCPLTEDDLYLINKMNNKNSVAVINKNDVQQKIDTSVFENNNIRTVYISAKENSGIDELHNRIEEIFKLNELTVNNVSAANERQKDCIDRALSSVDAAISALDNGELLDAVNVLVDEAEQSLLELTGKRITDAVVDEVFSRFCVGK